MSVNPDSYYMSRALELAGYGIFSAAPNPRVGCVLVKNNHIIGEGYHQRTGEVHAEIHALHAAGSAAEGATAYVTLEPCAHYGRTPPCASALINARIRKVVIACCDPNPQVAGKGIAMLNAAGIETVLGVCAEEAQALNRGFFKRILTGRPFVILKLAASLDGRTALANGESQWITGKAARQDVHYHRLAADAVIAGTGSIIKDNARLTARYPTQLPAGFPLRVIIDSQLHTPITAKVFIDSSPIWIACAPHARARSYPAHTELIRVPLTADKHIDLSVLLDRLGKYGINNAFIEAGAALAGAFIRQGLVDEILLYLAPCFLGQDARPLTELPSITSLSDKIEYYIRDSVLIGSDLRLTLTPR